MTAKSSDSLPQPFTSPRELVQHYATHGYRLIFWPAIGDDKGPREKNWQQHPYTVNDYQDGYRVGLMTGHEVRPGQYLHDVDIDWGDGAMVAMKLLPNTGFVFGRSTKRLSHCFYTATEALPSYKYEDLDKTCLIELRGTKTDGTLGMETMVPPSHWSKKGTTEPLLFQKWGDPAALEATKLKQSVCLAAVSMLLAKHLGEKGFNHETRLMFAGYLLRAGLDIETVVTMGEAILQYTKNIDSVDVRRAVESTANRLTDKSQKVKGGPALARALGERGKALIARINSWLGRDSDFVRNSDGVIIRDSQENISRAAGLLDIELTYNEFSDRLLLNGRHMEDRQLTDFWLRIDEEFHFRPAFEFFDKVVRRLAWEHGFHPVKDYLNGLQWDGVSRINTWLIDYAHAEPSDYLRAISAMVLIAAVRRIREPGCKFDEMLVLESSQGLNKSSALRALCPKPEWFSDDLPLNLSSQQMMERTLGKWLVEAADLAGKKKAEVEQLKAMLSRQVDGPARMAYARLPVERPRQFVIVGTTNSLAYLTDPTGARRFWPVRVRAFDLEGLSRARDQLWAEASHIESQGTSIRLPERLWQAASIEQEQRREIDAWEEAIEEMIRSTHPSYSGGQRRLVTTHIWEMLGVEVAKRDRLGALRIAEIMQRYGFHRTRVKYEGKTVVGYEGPIEFLPFGDLPGDRPEDGSLLGERRNDAETPKRSSDV